MLFLLRPDTVRSAALLREARLRAGYSQVSLAELSGKDRAQVARWEAGAVAPSLDTLVEMVRACGFDIPLELAPLQPVADDRLNQLRQLSPERRLDQVIGPGARAPIFCTLQGGRLDSSYVRRLLPRLARKAGVDRRVHAHGLRHTYAAELEGDQLQAHRNEVLRGLEQLLESDLARQMRDHTNLSKCRIRAQAGQGDREQRRNPLTPIPRQSSTPPATTKSSSPTNSSPTADQPSRFISYTPLTATSKPRPQLHPERAIHTTCTDGAEPARSGAPMLSTSPRAPGRHGCEGASGQQLRLQQLTPRETRIPRLAGQRPVGVQCPRRKQSGPRPCPAGSRSRATVAAAPRALPALA
jgi:transcriptional regulator with XRE-family HTH domain